MKNYCFEKPGQPRTKSSALIVFFSFLKCQLFPHYLSLLRKLINLCFIGTWRWFIIFMFGCNASSNSLQKMKHFSQSTELNLYSFNEQWRNIIECCSSFQTEIGVGLNFPSKLGSPFTFSQNFLIFVDLKQLGSEAWLDQTNNFQEVFWWISFNSEWIKRMSSV